VEGGRDDFCVGLVEVVAFVDSPSRVGYPVVEVILRGRGDRGTLFVRVRFVIVFCLPGEDCPVFADSVDLRLLRRPRKD